MGVIRWLERFGTDGRIEAAMESAARGLRDKYPPLFLREETRGIPPVAPLHGGSVPLTRSQVADLSEGEIIARWPQVCSALQQR